MNTIANTIFSRPPIVLEKVRLSEILELLRDRVNKSYMPSANGRVEFNSKPEYTEIANSQFPDFPVVHSLEQSGYFCLQRHDYQGGREPVFYNLQVAEFQIVIRLNTEQTIIRLISSPMCDDNPFIEWKDDPEQTIPLHHDQLKELIDIYG